MSDPRRWLDPRSGASDDLRSLLDAASTPPPLPPGVRTAGAKYVASLSKVAVAAPATAVSVKAVALLGAVGTVATLGTAIVRAPKHRATSPHAASLRGPRRATPPSTAIAPSAPSPVEAPTVAASSPAQASPLAPSPVPSPVAWPTPVALPSPATQPAAPSVPSTSVLRVRSEPRVRTRRWALTTPASAGPMSVTPTEAPPSEETLIEEARTALRGSPARALRLAQTAPADGALAEERAWLILRALDGLGRGDEARDAASAFVARWPDSVFTESARARLATPD